ncbi:hypothetical protein ACFPN1_08210 [Lysobacter yangpyeongensis]|uniref:DUF4148 domain-containing protein n=1 Tax=Lysobacter yangpyeongensis TaxID=346182 RepID=A0ABW0SLQ4_9GAMM
MNTRLAILAAVLMAASAPALAGGDNPCRQLAQETGLSERKVNMVLGNRTSFAEYTYTYDRSLARLRKTIGEGRYDQLMNKGELISASVDVKARALLAALDESRDETRATP